MLDRDETAAGQYRALHGDRIVTAARGWIGTPYRHQASVKGVGADCLGLVRGVWRCCCGPELEEIPAYAPDWSEAGGAEDLCGALRRWLIARNTAPPDPGDVLLFRMRDGAVAKHLGIAARGDFGATFIHAFARHGIVESPLSEPWARRIVARFVFPVGVS
jgi:NlpC/P60 family putative phage cell wall peptidase